MFQVMKNGKILIDSVGLDRAMEVCLKNEGSSIYETTFVMSHDTIANEIAQMKERSRNWREEI